MNLKHKIDENKTVRVISKAIYEFLVEQQIFEKVQKKIDELNEIGQIDLANEYESSLQNIIEILDETKFLHFCCDLICHCNKVRKTFFFNFNTQNITVNTQTDNWDCTARFSWYNKVLRKK